MKMLMSAASLHAFKMLQKIQQRGDRSAEFKRNLHKQITDVGVRARSTHPGHSAAVHATADHSWLSESTGWAGGGKCFTEALHAPSLGTAIYLPTCWSSPLSSVC